MRYEIEGTVVPAVTVVRLACPRCRRRRTVESKVRPIVVCSGDPLTGVPHRPATMVAVR